MSNADGPPTAELLEQFLLGTLPPEAQKWVEDFVANDPTAAQTLHGLNRSADTLLTAIQASQSVPPAEPEVRDLINTAKRLPAVNSGDKTTAMPGGPSWHAATDELTAWKERLGPAERPDELGRLGGYRLLRVLGRGGMGVVFEAEDPRLGRRVALKVVRPSIAEDQTTHNRFLREARATAAVEHENIVTIHQVGEDRGVPYLAMPLLQGESLEDRLRREGRLPIEDVIRIGREIALGLAAAHEQGLIHRDIKPGNIWLDARSGRVKILDFGLARGTEQAAEHITQTGAIVGTPAYMAPEQAEGLTLDSRCDLFSLGCVLYRLATGELPFPGNSAIQILSSLASRTPPRVDTLVPNFPSRLSDVIARLMAKSPTDRPATADEVCRLLDRVREIPALSTQPILKRAASRGGWIAIVALFAAMGSGVWWLFGGTIILIATNQGELTVHLDDRNIEVIVLQNDAEVHHKSTQRRFRVRPVNGEVEFLDPETGAVALTRTFQMQRAGERASVTITASQLAAARTNPAQADIASVPKLANTPSPISVPATSPPAPSTNVASIGGLAFGEAGRIDTPLLLPINTSLTVELDVTPGDVHPRETHCFLFQHNRNLDIKIMGDRAAVSTGGGHNLRANILGVNLVQPGRRRQIAATGSDTGAQLFVDGKLIERQPSANPDTSELRKLLILGLPPTTIANFRAFDGVVHRVRISTGERYNKSYTPEAEWQPDESTLVLYDFRTVDPKEEVQDLSGKGNHGKIVSSKWVPPRNAVEPVAQPAAAVSGLDFSETGRIDTPLLLPVDTPLTVEFDVTHGEVHPQETHCFLFQHPGNLDIKIMGNRALVSTGGWPNLRASFYQVDVAQPGRRRQIAVTGSDTALQLFVDGKLVERKASLTPEANGMRQLLTLGKPGAIASFRAFDGLVHRVRISRGEQYDKAYTPETEWQADETTLVLYDFRTVDPGSEVQDLSGKGNHGKIVSSKWVKGAEPSAAANTPAVPQRYALDFSSSDDSNPPHVALPKMLNQRQPFTMEMFVTADVIPGKHSMLFTAQGRPKLFISGGRNIVWQVQSEADPNVLWNAQGGDYPSGRRAHLAAVSTGTELRLYVDGVSKGTVDVTIPDFHSNCIVGANPRNKDPLWSVLKGQIDQIRISTTARYNNAFASPRRMESDPSTLAFYPFDEGDGDVLHDRSGNGHHGQIIGAKWVPLPTRTAAENTKAAVTVTNRFALQFDGDDEVKVRDVNWGRFEDYTLESYVTPGQYGDAVGFIVYQKLNTTLALNRRDTLRNWFMGFSHSETEAPEYLYGNAPAELNKRVHLAGVVNRQQFRLYVDGKLAGTTTAKREQISVPGETLVFGGNYIGTIDGIRLSKSARYEAPFTPPSRMEKDDETLALYQFAEGAGEFLMDSSGNGHHGQIAGAKWVPVAAP